MFARVVSIYFVEMMKVKKMGKLLKYLCQNEFHGVSSSFYLTWDHTNFRVNRTLMKKG